jgi:hypothetical protein
MSTATLQPTLEATPKKAARKDNKGSKSSPKKKAAKKGAKKASAKKKGAKVERTVTDDRDTVRLQVFKLLRKHPNGLTVPQIQEKLGLKGKPAIVKHECLADNPRIRREKHEEPRAMVYMLTARGKKAIEDGTVNSDAPESSAGYTDK